MLGRAAYQDPWLLARLQVSVFRSGGAATREEAVHAMTRYLEAQAAAGVPVKHVSRHVLGLFQGLPGAKRWRRHISENAHLDSAGTRLLEDALASMQPPAPGSAQVHGDALE